MAIKDRTVTIKGDVARVASVQLFPQPDGSVVITVAGLTNDSEGRLVALKEAQMSSRAGQNAALDDLMNLGLAALRKVNGLEDGAVPIEPKPEAVAVPVEAAPEAVK